MKEKKCCLWVYVQIHSKYSWIERLKLWRHWHRIVHKSAGQIHHRIDWINMEKITTQFVRSNVWIKFGCLRECVRKFISSKFYCVLLGWCIDSPNMTRIIWASSESNQSKAKEVSNQINKHTNSSELCRLSGVEQRNEENESSQRRKRLHNKWIRIRIRITGRPHLFALFRYRVFILFESFGFPCAIKFFPVSVVFQSMCEHLAFGIAFADWMWLLLHFEYASNVVHTIECICSNKKKRQTNQQPNRTQIAWSEQWLSECDNSYERHLCIVTGEMSIFHWHRCSCCCC